jgi:RND family efflux transporter MFP subunit
MKRRLVLQLAVLPLVLCAARPATLHAQPGGGATPVAVEAVIERAVPEIRTFTGSVLPSKKSVVGSAVDGRVVKLLVDDGDWVDAGEPLAELRKATIQLEIAAAKAELQLRKYEFDELNNGSRPEEIEQAAAAEARSQALLEYAVSRLERAKSLGGVASQEELEEARSGEVAARQSWLEAKATLKLVNEGPREERILQAGARVAFQEAEVARLEEQLDRHTIRAPFDGYVTAEHAEVGQWVARADPIVDMVAIDPVEVSVSVPEDYIAALEVGAPVTVRLDAMEGQFIPANITRIVPEADLRSRSFPIKISIDNPRGPGGHSIRAGMLAQVTFAVRPPRPGFLVSKDALVLGGPTPLVYVVATDPRTQQPVANPVQVELGIAYEGLMQVEGAVKAGDQVVVRGNERLLPGVPIKIVETYRGRDSAPD